MPSYSQVSSSPSVAAGVPVLELIRKFEDERILSREDRVCMNEALYNPERREAVVKALQAIELGSNPRFAIRRLKAIIHQNGTGEVSSKKNAPLKGSPVRSSAELDTQLAIAQVITRSPMYANPENFNVCSKIARRLQDFLMKYKPSAMGIRKFAVLIGSGSFNPLTRMHLRSYFVAKQYLESKCGFVVLGSLLSPSHSMTVRERYRTNQRELMPSPHRLAIAQLLVKDSKWLSIDPWEITRRRPMDYLSLLQHTSKMLSSHFPEIDIKVLYLAKANAVPKIAPSHLREQSGDFGVVSVCRAMEYDSILAGLGAKWNGLIHCVEDTAVLDATMDIVTSRRVREKIRAGANIAPLVGDAINQYAKTHKLGPKMLGQEEWSEEEKKLPVALSRPNVLGLQTRGSILSTTGTGLSTAAGAARKSDQDSVVIDDSGVMVVAQQPTDCEHSDDDSVGGSVVGGYENIDLVREDLPQEPAVQNEYQPSWSPRPVDNKGTGVVSSSSSVRIEEMNA
eukprot:GSChrysophyteH1.ASY1.ANO1.2722.1 assembled CDS